MKINEQLAFPGYHVPLSEQIVNVSKVKHRSPFRYPGGKTWLIPRIRCWLHSLPALPARFIEPFAGGAIVGLTVAFEQLAHQVLLVELDERVGAVWQAILNENYGEWLAAQIEAFDLTIENVTDLLGRTDLPLQERAFQTIVHNRVSRGGIMANGAGLIKHGDGKGIASRWYPQTIARRIRDLDRIRDRVEFVWGDGLDIIERNLGDPDAVFFIDPPYTAGQGKLAGRRLYTHSELDHERLFTLMEAARGDFLMTYENAPSVQRMAEDHGFTTAPIAMKNTHHAKMTELLIGKDLSWIM